MTEWTREGLKKNQKKHKSFQKALTESIDPTVYASS